MRGTQAQEAWVLFVPNLELPRLDLTSTSSGRGSGRRKRPRRASARVLWAGPPVPVVKPLQHVADSSCG
jgi:hypothetical protein